MLMAATKRKMLASHEIVTIAAIVAIVFNSIFPIYAICSKKLFNVNVRGNLKAEIYVTSLITLYLPYNILLMHGRHPNFICCFNAPDT